MGLAFWERKWRRVDYPECRVEVAAGSLLTYRQSQNGVGWGEQGGEPPPPPGGPDLLDISTEMSIADPVPGGGGPGRGLELDQPTGSLCATPCTGHNSDTVGKEPPVTQVTPV